MNFLNQDNYCNFANDEDSEWRKLNVISRAGKATGKNKHLMNVALEQGKPFWQKFEPGLLEWKASEIRPTSDEENIMISSSDHNLETAKKELQSWVKNKVHTQVSDQGQPRISIRWVYTNKNLNDKQVC